MSDDAPRGGPGPLAALGAVISAATSLLRNEASLVRAELSNAVSEARGGLILVVVAAVFGMVGLNLLAGAVVAGIIALGLPPFWSAVIVGGCFLGLALGCGVVARQRFARATLVPERAARNLKADAATLTGAFGKGDGDAQG